jgi:hypothetical protein
MGRYTGNRKRVGGPDIDMKTTITKIKKIAACFLTFCLCASTAFAARDEKEEERVKDAGVVLKEILNIPDDIPQDLLDKAECLVILPSVLKGCGDRRRCTRWRA